MVLSQMDIPRDQYGAVSDVARPLLHRMNQATMDGSTFDALVDLIRWANKALPEIEKELRESPYTLSQPQRTVLKKPQ